MWCWQVQEPLPQHAVPRLPTRSAPLHHNTVWPRACDTGPGFCACQVASPTRRRSTSAPDASPAGSKASADRRSANCARLGRRQTPAARLCAPCVDLDSTALAKAAKRVSTATQVCVDRGAIATLLHRLPPPLCASALLSLSHRDRVLRTTGRDLVLAATACRQVHQLCCIAAV